MAIKLLYSLHKLLHDKVGIEMNQQEILSIRDKIKSALAEQNMPVVKKLTEELEEIYHTGLDNLEIILIITTTIAKYYRKARNYDKSAKYSREAINTAKKLASEQMAVQIEASLDYAKLELLYNQHTSARKILAALLQLLEKHKWSDHYAYGLTYRLLAKVGIEDMMFDTSVNQLEEALLFLKKAVSNDHPIIYQTVEDLTEVHIRMENYHKALHLQEQLLETYQESNNKHIMAAIQLKIGEIYFYLDLKQARRSITIAIELLGELDSPVYLETAKANLLLAELDENMENYPRSITYYKRALTELKHAHNREHFMTVYAYSKIGTIAMKINELPEAKAYLEEGLDLAKEHPRIRMQFLYALGKLYSNEKSYQKAYTMFRSFLEQLDQDDRKKTKAYADTLQAIAFNFIEEEKIDAAFDYYQTAVDIYKQLKPACPEELGFASIRLAYCSENKQLTDLITASKWYQFGVEKIEKVRNKAISEEAYAGIIDFYTRNEDPIKRTYYENKLVKLQIS